MSKRSKPRSGRRRSTDRRPVESRAVVFFTVGWMVAVAAGLILELVFVAVNAYLWYQPGSQRLIALQGLSLIGAVVVGICSLAMMRLVVVSSRTKPPPGIVVFAVVVALAPWPPFVLRLLPAP